MNKPEVSVIMPTYNRAYLIAESIESVLSQTFSNFELIIVDDNSQDETEEIVKSFKDRRIKYIKHQRNLGASESRNTGIKESEGEFIAFLDSDDIWLPEKLEKQLEVIKGSRLNPGLVYCGVKFIDTNGNTTPTNVPLYRGNLKLLLMEENIMVGAGSTALIKRECFEKVGLFDTELPSRQDLDMWLRISDKYTFDYAGLPLAYMRIHSDRITEDLDLRIMGRKILYHKISSQLSENRRALARYFYETGILHFCRGNMEEGRRFLLRAFTTFPHFRTVIALGISMLGRGGFDSVIRVVRRMEIDRIIRVNKKFIAGLMSLMGRGKPYK